MRRRGNEIRALRAVRRRLFVDNDNALIFPGGIQLANWQQHIEECAVQNLRVFDEGVSVLITRWVILLHHAAATKIKKWWTNIPMFKRMNDWALARVWVRRMRSEMRKLYIYIAITNRSDQLLSSNYSDFDMTFAMLTDDFKAHIRQLFVLKFVHNKTTTWWNNCRRNANNGWSYFHKVHNEGLLGLRSSDNMLFLALQTEVMYEARAGLLTLEINTDDFFMLN